MICNCSSEKEELQISFNGKRYSYVKMQHTIKDIEEESMNTSWIESDNLIIQYSNEYKDYLGNMISYSEEGYKRIAEDLQYSLEKFKLQIWFLNNIEYKRITQAASGAVALGDMDGVALINIDLHSFDQNVSELVAHEITHLISNRISGASYQIMLNKHPEYAQSFRCFNEALAQTEDQSREPVDKMLFQCFPSSNFKTLEEIDSQKNTRKNYHASVVEMRALIVFILEKWGQDTLVDIIHLIGKHSLMQAIEKCINVPTKEFQAIWFEYMTVIIDKYEKNKP
ncbi:MAG: hypothetical protein GF311_00510 [Candidatus Lokiarchaeota archaeon]|nr:hypothetical protein [Candidatus Lokiarchaeota archaeon]